MTCALKWVAMARCGLKLVQNELEGIQEAFSTASGPIFLQIYAKTGQKHWKSEKCLKCWFCIYLAILLLKGARDIY